MPAASSARRNNTLRVSALSILVILPLAVLLLSFFYSSELQGPRYTSKPAGRSNSICSSTSADRGRNNCNFADGEWVFDGARDPLYGEACPFQRSAWNCGKNKRSGLDAINRWKWVPHHCGLPPMDPERFLFSIQNMNLGFVGDSLNENLLVSLLCILASADMDARRCEKRKARRGAYFPKYNVTVGYHRAVLLAEYHECKAGNLSGLLEKLGFKRGYQVNVDLPAPDWIDVTDFCDIVIFNTGHCHAGGVLISFLQTIPFCFINTGNRSFRLGLRDGLKVVLQHMVPYAERKIPSGVLKIWRTQSPRHFEGGEWNQNGTCVSERLLKDYEVEEWFGNDKGGVNREAREVNAIIRHALEGASFQLLNVSYMSEYRKDAHPAIWLGQKNAHVIWGQDCMHWCLPGLPDTWVNILFAMVLEHLESKQAC